MSRSVPPYLRGREDDLARVRRQLTRTASGVGTVTVVEGRAGLGKTALVAACVDIAAKLSFRVGVGRAEPARTAVELEPLLDALFDGPTPIVERSSLTILRASSERTFWLLQDLQSRIEEVALTQPVLICLDDLHWAGSTSALAMRELPRRLADLPVAWLMTLRPAQGSPLVIAAKNELLEQGAEFISLGPLERAAVAQMAADILGAEPDEQLLEMAERAHGTPFLLDELFRGLLAEGLVAVEGDKAILRENRVPQRVAKTIQRRLSEMSTAAERTALLAASLGRRFTVQELASLIGSRPSELVAAIREVIDADIFNDAGDHLEFRHDLIREGARVSVASTVRRALDRQAVDVLVARGALAIEVADQLVTSAEVGDEAAIDTLLDASESLTITDPTAAAELLARALELTPPRHPKRGTLVSRRTVALFTADLADEAKEFADTELRRSLSADEEAEVRSTVAWLFDLSPDVRADSARRALALPGLSADRRATLWTSLLHAVAAAVRTDDAVRLTPMARDAVQVGDAPQAWYALGVAEAMLSSQLGDFGGALILLDDADRRPISEAEDPRRRRTVDMRASFLATLDRFDEAFEIVQEGIAAAQQDRQNWALRMFETWTGRHLLQLGRLDEAAVALDARFNPRDAHRIVGPGAASNVVALGKVKLHTGSTVEADEIAEVTRVMLRATTPGVQRHAAWYLALHAMHRSDTASAHRWLCALGEAERLNALPIYPIDGLDAPQVVRIAIAAGDDELARVMVTKAQRRSEMNRGVQSLAGAAAHAMGLWKGSVHALERATALFTDGQRPLATASALEDLGRLRAEQNATQDAIAALDAALTITLATGATWDAARLRRRLRALGITRRVAPGARPKTGWKALTAAEVAVARLAAEGNTDRQVAEKLFISPHTVNTHLRHVYEKLGVNSRLALSKIAPPE